MIDSVFCATKMSKMMRITKPTTSAHHAAASRVNDVRLVRGVATLADAGGWEGTGDSVLMLVTSPNAGRPNTLVRCGAHRLPNSLNGLTGGT